MSLEESVAGLMNLQLTKGRLEQKVVRGIQVLDDTYNANPDSMKAALLTLSQMSTNGRRIAVLGRMGELGAESERGHRSVDRRPPISVWIALLALVTKPKLIAEEAWRGGIATVVKAKDQDEAVKALRDYARAGDIILVKGSRSSQMERIVEGLAA
jgi:UDP-N-acetylmuramyl pentapeptide synthase